MSKIDMNASMVVWEDANTVGIPRFTIWDKNRKKVYFPAEGRGRVDITSWDEAAVNQKYMDEGCTRIAYDTLPEKVKIAIQAKRNG